MIQRFLAVSGETFLRPGPREQLLEQVFPADGD